MHSKQEVPPFIIIIYYIYRHLSPVTQLSVTLLIVHRSLIVAMSLSYLV